MNLFFSEKNLPNLDRTANPRSENNLIHNFIKELQNAITKTNSIKLIEKLPWHTTLTFAKYENNYAMCFDYNKGNIYYLPKENIIGNMPEVSEALKFHSPREILC